MNRYEQLMTNKYLTWLRLSQFLLALVIYTTLLLTPNPQIVTGYAMNDLMLHALGNAILMLSVWTASGGRYKSMGPLIFVLPFSLIIELAQGLTDNRTPELGDVVANITGAIIGYILCNMLYMVVEMLRKQEAA